MSIKVQSHVWDHSPAKGGELLILLAIADFADDGGIAWPSVSTLAQKSRLSERQTQRNIRNLVASGDLAIDENAGPHGTHRYRVLRVSSRHPRQNDGVTSTTGRGDICDTKGVTPTSPEPPVEPSENHHSFDAANIRGSRIPEDFTVTNDLMAWAIELGLTTRFIEWETEKFIDYWRGATGRNAVKKDWAGTWRNWMRKALDDRRPGSLTRLEGGKAADPNIDPATGKPWAYNHPKNPKVMVG